MKYFVCTRRCALVFAFVLAFCAQAGVAQAQVQPLTLAQAQRLAVERSLQLVAGTAAIQSAQEMAVASAQNPDPVLRLGIENLPADGPDRFSTTRDFMTMRRVGLMQEFTRADKRQLRGERYEREADKARAEQSAMLADIQRDTALAWLERYYAEAMVALMTEQIKQAQLEIDAADSAYRAGRGSQADVYAARSMRVALEDQASELARKQRTAKTVLARWIGSRDAEAPLADKPVMAALDLHDHALEKELARHPRIEMLSQQVAQAETEARLAQANQQADWSAEVAYSQRGPQYSNMISFGISIPLQWDRKNRQGRELAAKLAQVEQAKAEREEMLRAHVAEVKTMLAEWDNARERQTRIADEMLPLAMARTQAVLSAWRGGKSSLNEVLNAQRNETEVQLQALQLEQEAARLWAQLNFLLPDASSMNSKDTK
ncbi:MAG: TolC family protein [Burkholderiaceae bacterium]|nr:MAG: TolC family protein [Burkholderiaceae bacterium]